MLIDVTADNCRLVDTDWPRPDAALVKAFATSPAANVGDAMDRFGVMSSSLTAQCPGARCVGPAFTVLTREGDNLAIHRAMDEVQPGDVLVVNGLGADTRAVFGDILAELCVQKGVAGVVVDGAVRDAAAIARLGFPLWAKANTPAGPTKSGPGEIGGVIACGGVVVSPGDLIVADDDGIAVVPQHRVTEVRERLTTIEQFESRLRTRIRGDVAEER
ncbi:methyltransferase [Kribbella lupini]|uniref:Putative 4-hydroxy-4-methyl-2-oxoglutarate aldolase n=1 Tax=Kribbella lupini TaxID=291602 RepID=A0ABN2CL46_9ACTN